LAFAYGSGVFEQDGNVSKGNMTDLVLVVENSEEWHKQNLAMNPKDYTSMRLNLTVNNF
jgi:translocator assembly and maintenance protein 41